MRKSPGMVVHGVFVEEIDGKNLKEFLKNDLWELDAEVTHCKPGGYHVHTRVAHESGGNGEANVSA